MSHGFAFMLRRSRGEEVARGKGGFVLVLVLMIVAALSVVLVAFHTSLRAEAATGNAIAHAARARQALDAGLDLGMSQMRVLSEEFPDGATFWDAVEDRDGRPLVEGTFLQYRSPVLTGPRYRVPLFSGALAREVGEPGPVWELPRPDLPFDDPVNSVDLNRARFPGDRYGRLGSPAGGRRVVRVPWVEWRDASGRVTSRFAFYIEDDSFRLNAQTAGPALRGVGPGVATSEVPLQALLRALGWSAQVEEDTEQLVALREEWGEWPDLRLADTLPLSRPTGVENWSDAARFWTTLDSGGSDLSRTGARRLDLNAVIADTEDLKEIRAQLDRILAALSHEVPDFGQRFYRLRPEEPNAVHVSEEHARIYLEKIAAHLRDEIDADSQPTVVYADGTIAGPDAGPIVPAGSHPLVGPNPVIAFGKEAVPFLQEFAVRARLTLLQPAKRSGPSGATMSRYAFTLDYYFEFWNMTGRDIVVGRDLGPNAELRIANQPGFDTGTGGTQIRPGRPFSIPLPDDLVFPAGKVTVLTTDKNPPAGLLADPDRLVTLEVDANRRTYQGTTRLVTTDGGFRVNLIPRSTASTDYEMTMVLANDRGLIESFGALPFSRGDSYGNLALSLHNDDMGVKDPLPIQHPDLFFVRGGSLRGNRVDPTLIGDPRTNNEQLILRRYDSSGDAEQTRFYSSGLGNQKVPGESTLGEPNANYVDPIRWPEPFVWREDGVNAPMEIGNRPLQSIGELGRLFDPQRALGPTGEIAYSRGGGRTLPIGEPDPLWDGSAESASRHWAAWRLCDVFSAGRPLQQRGLINPNGLRRDGGVAFRALLEGYRLERDESLLSASVVETLLQRLSKRLEDGPLEERGELSELLDLPDGGAREELFRRLVELTTTRGNTFTIYAIGQSLIETPSGERKVRATAQRQLTFELVPEWVPALKVNDFDPSLPEEVAARFRPPDRFRVRVLRAGP